MRSVRRVEPPKKGWACFGQESPYGGRWERENRACSSQRWRLSHKHRPPQPPETIVFAASSALPPRPSASTHRPTHHHNPPKVTTMAPRTKKEDTGELMVSIAQFTHTRDQVRTHRLLHLLHSSTRPFHVVATQELAQGSASSTTTNMSPIDTRIVLVAFATRLRSRNCARQSFCAVPCCARGCDCLGPHTTTCITCDARQHTTSTQ